MADTFRLDYVGTKAGIKGASVVMGYLETGMRVLDSASGLLARLQELAILGGNDTNSIADHEAINLEAEAIADEFNRLMTSATYKGKDIFVDTAGSEYVSMGGRDAQMTFGIGKIDYSSIYTPQASVTPRDAGLPNEGALFNLAYAPSDAVVGPVTQLTGDNDGTTYEMLSGTTYEIVVAPSANADAAAIVANSDLTDVSQVIAGSTFTMSGDVSLTNTETVSVREIDASVLTREIEAIQKKINGARVQAGSQYAALESAVQYTTDLTAQYELGYNTVNDVNFSMETAHLAKNQILQQAATAMLAQANSGQQGLLQLIS